MSNNYKTSLIFLALISFIGCLSYAQEQYTDILLKSDDDQLFSISFSPVDKKEFKIYPALDDWNYHLQAPVLSSLKIAHVDSDSIKDIIATSYGQQPNPYQSGYIYIFDYSGAFLPGWPIQVNSPIPATASIGDLENDGITDIVVGSWTRLYAWDAAGNTKPGFPINFGTSVTSSLFDVEKDGELEIIYPSNNSLFVLNPDGTVLPGFPTTIPDMIGSPAVADIDSDGEYEIVSGTFQGPVGPDPFEIYAWNIDGSLQTGFPIPTCGVVKAAPAVGDIDMDEQLEIAVIAYHTSNEDSLYVFDGTGTMQTGFPVGVSYGRLSSPVFGDIDGDGDQEIVIGGYSNIPPAIEVLFAFHHNGDPLSNWPVTLTHPGSAGNINSSPILADVDGDTSQTEILVKVVDHIFALHANGTVVNGYPIFIDDENHTGTFSPSPAIDDLDNDGDIEIIYASNSGQLVGLDLTNIFDEDFALWPMFKYDQYNTSATTQQILTKINPDISVNNKPEDYKLIGNFPNPFNNYTNIKYAISQIADVTLKIFNTLGQRILTLENKSQPAGEHTIVWNGKNLTGNDVPSGIYFYSLELHYPNGASSAKLSKANKMVLMK